jgi:transglutaminase-like putative cysteine protease
MGLEMRVREGWVTVLCFLLMVLCVAWSIQAVDWTNGLSILQGMVVLGGLLGMVLAKSHIPNRMANLLSVLAGWTLAVYLTSQVIASATGLSAALAVADLEQRLYDLFAVLFTEGASADNYVFLLLLACILWVVAYSSAWAIFRWQRVWWAVIICGVALLVNISSTSKNLTGYVILFLLFALLLVVRANLAMYEQQWRKDRVGYSRELVTAFLQAGLVVSLAVILLAWVAPVALASRPLQSAWDKITEPWQRFQERSARIFQDLNYQNEPPLISLGDRRMWFGGPVQLSDTPIADVEADSGRYWRVLVFHEYTGDGWLSNEPDIISIGEDEQKLAFPAFEARFEMTQTVTVYQGWQIGDALIAAAQPLRADLPLRAAVAFITYDEDLGRRTDLNVIPPAPGDPSALYPRRALATGESYQVYSSLTEADEESLRQAGTSYPQWVAPRYLQLPDSFPERVKSLAEQITEGLDTPYDKAKAIEGYLRQIPYDDQISGPRQGQDGVEYFLFDAQAGYCDYYASAMVVMLRSVGVPARYVRGYSQGAKVDGVYRLLESDGHAWPEVFFPGYGWVEFEPTGGEPPLNRPSGLASEEPDRLGPDVSRLPLNLDDVRELDMERGRPELQEAAQRPPLWQRLRWWGWAGLSLPVLGAAVFGILAVRRRRRIEGLSVAERVYEDLVNWVRRLLRIEPLVHQTPLEYAGVVSQHVPRGRPAVERIAGLYVEERFSGRTISGTDAEAAWSRAWPALCRRWLERRFERVQRLWWRFVPPREAPRQ